MTAAEFYDNASHSLKELLNYIEVRTYAKSEEDGQKLPWFIFVLSRNDTDIYKHSKVPLDKNNTSKIYYDSEKYFVLQNYSQFGQCFTFVVPKEVKNLTVLKLH